MKKIWWANEDGAIIDSTIRAMFNDDTLTILAEDDKHITVQWSNGEIELFTKQIRSGRNIIS